MNSFERDFNYVQRNVENVQLSQNLTADEMINFHAPIDAESFLVGLGAMNFFRPGSNTAKLFSPGPDPIKIFSA